MEVITTHMNADFDSLASMVAAKKLYPDAVLSFSGSQEKNVRDFLARSESIQADFKRQKQIPLEKVTKLILVDTRQARRLGNFAKCLDNPGLELHIYDHHPDAPDGTACDDGDVCTAGDECESGLCVSGTPACGTEVQIAGTPWMTLDRSTGQPVD